ncbi:melatonin receptor type 1C-like [Patiria miniata]|uniref:G-protein coupled receptors family 1 profile domain-containing protein n=1 Tax=Patiria miniata TaxID=46514 RepID=A0A914AJL4_PATMI|nr:melatonin receptor type 1C-like [Patiria miniata]
MDEQDNETCCQSMFSSYSRRQGIVALIAVMAILGVFGNCLVIAAVTLSRKLRNPTNMFVFNLSIADLLVCGFVLPGQATALLAVDNSMPDIMCSLTAVLQILSTGCSINNLACIAINRYLIVSCRKATYLKLFNRRRTSLAIILTWLIPACAMVVQQVVGNVKLDRESMFSYCSWVDAKTSDAKIKPVVVGAFLPVQFVLICFCYGRLFYRIRTHTRRVQHLGGAIRVATVMEAQHRWAGHRPAGHRPNQNQHQIKVTMNLFCVVCSFVVCFTPYIFLFVFKRSLAFTLVAGVLALGNSCINPMLYAAKHPEFKKVFHCIIRGKFAQIPGRVTFKCFN